MLLVFVLFFSLLESFFSINAVVETARRTTGGRSHYVGCCCSPCGYRRRRRRGRRVRQGVCPWSNLWFRCIIWCRWRRGCGHGWVRASPFSLITTGIFPNQAQTTSPMVCWWRWCTWLGTRTTTGRAICVYTRRTSRRHAVSSSHFSHVFSLSLLCEAST